MSKEVILSDSDTDADVDTVADDDADVQGLEKLLIKYFYQADAKGDRKCRLCEKIPSGQRRGTGSVVSFTLLFVSHTNCF